MQMSSIDVVFGSRVQFAFRGKAHKLRKAKKSVIFSLS